MLNLIKTAQLRILRSLLDTPGQTIRVRESAKKANVSPATVSLISEKMRGEGIIKSGRIDLSHPMTRLLKILLNIMLLSPCIAIIKKHIETSGIGVYGSWTKGTNTEQSDIDLWFKVKKYPNPMNIAKLRAELRNKLGAEPSMLFLTKDRMDEIRKNNPSLYFSLLHSFRMWGGEID